MIEIKDFLNDIKERIATEENYYIAMLIITITVGLILAGFILPRLQVLI